VLRTRRLLPAILGLLSLLLAQPAAAAPKKKVTVTRDKVADGDHWRIANGQGVIHVWLPPGYRRARAGVVVYIHGYHISVDKTWRNQRLAQQFRDSRQNALFVAVGAPKTMYERVKFPSLREVLRAVTRHARLRLPRGHIVGVAHSAGFRTITKWLDYRYLDHVILVDALYAKEETFYRWMVRSRWKDWHRLVVVAKKTLPQTKRLMKRFRRVVTRDNIPTSYSEFTARERGARILFLKSQYGHSELVYNRKVIPLLLRLTRLRLLSPES
jgi:hypothetical protein